MKTSHLLRNITIGLTVDRRKREKTGSRMTVTPTHDLVWPASIVFLAAFRTQNSCNWNSKVQQKTYIPTPLELHYFTESSTVLQANDYITTVWNGRFWVATTQPMYFHINITKFFSGKCDACPMTIQGTGHTDGSGLISHLKTAAQVTVNASQLFSEYACPVRQSYQTQEQ
jgi:hypothetical protein